VNITVTPATTALQTALAAAPARPATKAGTATAMKVANGSAPSQATPAAKLVLTAVPPTVKPEDRAAYMPLLRSFRGNATLAPAALKAREAAEPGS
jgi:hypothetical protein